MNFFYGYSLASVEFVKSLLHTSDKLDFAGNVPQRHRLRQPIEESSDDLLVTHIDILTLM